MHPLHNRPPKEVVLDLVLTYAERLGKPQSAVIAAKGDRLGVILYGMVNHRGRLVTMSTEAHLDGEPNDAKDGKALRFVLRKLGPTVWKLSPSILDENIHGYITIVSVPEPAPWEST
jgi:hypothetical protein